MERISGIYAITHVDSGRSYIGSSKDILSRWAIHQKKLKSNSHHSSYLQNAWNKYGKEEFTFLILEHCHESVRVSREQFWIDQLQSSSRDFGFNMSSMAHAGCPGEEGRRNIAESNKRRIGLPWIPSDKESWKANLSASKTGKKYGKRNPDIGAKISKSLRGIPHSDERKRNISASIMALTKDARSMRAFKAWETKRANKSEVLNGK